MKLKFMTKILSLSILTSMILTASAFAISAGTTTASSLNLRAEPNTSSSILSKIPNASDIAVHYIAENGWAKVSYDGFTGFASAEYLELSEDKSFDLGTGYVTASGTLNVRSAPNTTATIVKKLNQGQSVEITGIKDDWYQVEVDGQTAYVHPDYVSIASATSYSSSNTSASRQNVLNYAAQFLGVPYVYGGSSPSGFDCSGFTSYVLKNFGISVSRSSSTQYANVTKISKSELLPGDLVFFSAPGTSSVAHVGMYVGDGQMIHAPSPGKSVRYENITSGYYLTYYIGSGRVIFN